LILVSFHRKLDAELIRPRTDLAKAAIVDISYSSDLKVEVVDNKVLHIRAVATPA
jgi:hypothetical protein